MRPYASLATVTAAVALVAIAVIELRSAPEPARVAAAVEPTGAVAIAEPAANTAEERRNTATRSRYRIEYSRTMTFGEQALPPVSARGTWTIEQLVRADLQQVVFEDSNGAKLPPFLIQADRRGRITAIGFDAAHSVETRDLLSTIATAMQLSAAEGSTLEEDLNGRYEATYTRVRPNALRRTRRYVAMRSPQGFRPELAKSFNVEGATMFELDGDGLAKLDLDEVALLELGTGGLSARAEIELHAQREAFEKITARWGADLELRPITQASTTNHTADSDVRLLGDADFERLMSAFSELPNVPQRGPEASKWRGTQLLRLRALLRLQPHSAADVARAIREQPNADPRQLSILAQSLGEANTPEARDALLGLLKSKLPVETQKRVALALGSLDTPTPETAAALRQMLDDPALGSVPPLALGTQAKNLAAEEGEAAAEAVDALLERYAQATDYNTRQMYLQALANSGDPRALEIMRQVLAGDDPRLAEVAAYGLRFIPGSEADATLEGLLAGPAPINLRVQAVRAIAFRDLASWRPRLEVALASEPTGEVHQAITALLAR